ncbi:C39 family peptidase [Vibrio kyushuensis]|uniref:C39 family peptidase n=1 Tax=Vibrio kyushuensis TaxID=2910249 RepID=UPI003D149ACB
MKICQLIIGVALIYSAPPFALDFFPSRGHFNVPVKSYQEITFGEVLRQQYDFSCGSAALASLLEFHYQTPSSEEDIFKLMYENGDKELIHEQGFSLLDMKQYLTTQGFSSDGFQLELPKLKNIGVPGITLVNFDGYMHFVVLKGINQKSVIIGDPSRGTLLMTHDEFSNYYQGIVLLIRNKAEIGKSTFIHDDSYAVRHSSPVGEGIVRDSLSTFSITLPEAGEY